MQHIDVIIIGAGAAGLMCAIEAAKRGRRVCVLEHANKPGRKILMSGGGRCNFTNLHVTADNFISHNPHFAKSALSRYTPQHFIALVEKYQIAYHEKTLGQLFCDHKAKEIVDLLLAECQQYDVTIKLNTSITEIIKASDHRFKIATSNDVLVCQSLVIATGGLSIPSMGSNPFGYKVAEQFKLKVWPTRAGLVPFTLHEAEKNKYSVLSGNALNCVVNCNNQQFREAMLFTHRGLSGPAMLQISNYWQPGQNLTINLLPDIDLIKSFKLLQQQHPNSLLKNFLQHYFPKKITEVWLNENMKTKTLQNCSIKTMQKIVDQFQAWQIKPNSTEGYRTAEVTLGGVDCDSLSSKTFAAKQVNGLYFIGEVVDVTGWLGGYNFQWAWASGFAAGQAV